MRSQDEGVNLALACGRLADNRHTREVGAVAFESSAEIEQHEVSGLELAT
jgi:hypothetical protein